MPEYYKVDGRKVTLREFWNIGRSWKVIIPWIGARLGAPMDFGVAFSLPESVRELEIPESECSPEARAKLQPLLEQCLQVGFHSPRYYLHQSLRRDVRTHFISMLHRSGEFTLRLMHSLATNASPPVENVLAVLLSELNDGTIFFTSDQRSRFKVPPGILNNRLIGAGPLQLIQSHQAKVAELAKRNPPQPVQSTEALDEVWDRYEKLSLDFALRRGLYVRMAPEEVGGQQKLVETTQAMTTGGVRHADVLMELSQLQNKKAGWGNAIWIFVVSMILFVGAGSRQWSWEYVLILVPVLFVHELGHYIAMRAFNYRNLRMFFIPFFGAAVAGQHYNVPGWKKVIVSMMGPAPGIVLGVIIGGAGMVLNQPLLIKVALVTLILNGINLLPVLPLDGGWIFHTLVFSRHHLLDAAFRVLAALALLAGGMFSSDKILMFLGVVMALGIPTAYRMARITRTLRESGIPPGSPDDQTIPTETAVAIIDELNKGLPKQRTTKMVAQQTLQIFETLNARPPGWLATSGLLIAYVATLGMALVFAGVLTVGRHGSFSGSLTNAVKPPKRALACGSVAAWPVAPAASTPETGLITIIANFPNPGEAGRRFQGITNRLPASATARTFGDSVFLTLPSGEIALRKEWFAEWQRRTKSVFMESSNTPATFSISCQLPTEKQAKEMEEELTEYFSANLAQSLIPPWQPNDDRTLAQRAAHQLARKSYMKAQASHGDEYKDPKMRALQKQMREAQQHGDDAELVALRKQVKILSAELTRGRLEKLKAGPEGTVDPALIDLFASWSASLATTNGEVTQKAMQDMSQRMGHLPVTNGVVDSVAERFSARFGYVTIKGRTLQLNWASFTRVSDGAPALLDWLCLKGGTDFKYDILPGTSIPDEE